MNEEFPMRDRTLKLLINRPAHISLKQIARDTGLNHGWLSMFKRGKIDDPSYRRLAKLFDYLNSITE